MYKQITVFIFLISCLSVNLQAQTWKSYYQKVIESPTDHLIVKRFDKFGIVDKAGKVLVKPKHDSIFFHGEGFFAKTKYRRLPTHFYSKEGRLVFENTNHDYIAPIDDPRWDAADDRIPILSVESALFFDSTESFTIPYNYRALIPFKEGSRLLIAESKKGKRAVITDHNELITDFIYEADIEEKLKGYLEDSYEDKVNENWQFRSDTLVYLSLNTGEELWSSPIQPIYIKDFELGVSVVQLKDKSCYLIDAAFDQVTKLPEGIKSVKFLLENGRLIVENQYTQLVSLNLEAKDKKDFEFQELIPLPLYSTGDEVPEKIRNFKGWYMASSKEGLFLWEPKTDTKIKIEDFSYAMSEYRPYAKSERYCVLLEVEGWEKAQNYFWNRTHVKNVHEAKIVDLKSARVVEDFNLNGKWGLANRESAHEENAWVFQEMDGEFFGKNYILWKDGQSRKFSNGRLSKLDPQAQFYIFEDYETGSRRIFDTEKWTYIIEGFKDALYFADSTTKRFLILEQESYNSDTKLYLSDVAGKKIKDLQHLKIDEINLVENQKNEPVLANIRKRFKEGSASKYSYRYENAIIDVYGKVVKDFDSYYVSECFSQDGKYAFRLSTWDKAVPYKFLAANGAEMDYRNSSWVRSSYPCFITEVDSLHLACYNLKTGKRSPAFKKGCTLQFVSSDEKSLLEQTYKEGDSLFANYYDLEDFKLLNEYNYQLNSINNKISIDNKTGKVLIDGHYWRIKEKNYSSVYRFKTYYINMDGECVENCD